MSGPTGLCLFEVTMRQVLGAIMHAAVSVFGMGEAVGAAAQSTERLSFALRSIKKYKSKPNKLSQKKRRLNARRLGKFK